MTRHGIHHSDVVDLITQEAGGTVRLILVQTETLTGNEILALHQKLDNYLSFATDGRLVASKPSTKDCPVVIRVDLYARPDALVLEFLRSFRVLALRKDVDLEVSIDQQTVAL